MKSKEAVIQHLEEENSQSRLGDGNLSAEKIEELTIALRHEKDGEIEVRKLLQLLHTVNLTWYGILKVLCVAVCVAVTSHAYQSSKESSFPSTLYLFYHRYCLIALQKYIFKRKAKYY